MISYSIHDAKIMQTIMHKSKQSSRAFPAALASVDQDSFSLSSRPNFREQVSSAPTHEQGNKIYKKTKTRIKSSTDTLPPQTRIKPNNMLINSINRIRKKILHQQEKNCLFQVFIEKESAKAIV